jgi:hypothetical protein
MLSIHLQRLRRGVPAGGLRTPLHPVSVTPSALASLHPIHIHIHIAPRGLARHASTAADATGAKARAAGAGTAGAGAKPRIEDIYQKKTPIEHVLLRPGE